MPTGLPRHQKPANGPNRSLAFIRGALPTAGGALPIPSGELPISGGELPISGGAFPTAGGEPSSSKALLPKPLPASTPLPTKKPPAIGRRLSETTPADMQAAENSRGALTPP
ncbi:hypothetical protein GCM10028822_04070 [Hymenobacter terrigena]